MMTVFMRSLIEFSAFIQVSSASWLDLSLEAKASILKELHTNEPHLRQVAQWRNRSDPQPDLDGIS